jgi:hypothetical protein
MTSNRIWKVILKMLSGQMRQKKIKPTITIDVDPDEIRLGMHRI